MDGWISNIVFVYWTNSRSYDGRHLASSHVTPHVETLLDTVLQKLKTSVEYVSLHECH